MEDKNSNISQASKWIISVINDIGRVKRSYEANDYADSIYRCQFAIEKINKSILMLFGFQFKRTQTPSKIIGSILKTKRELIDNESRKILEIIVENSKKFEKLKTTPKYGFLEDGDLTLPEEIYSSKEEIRNFLKDFIQILNDWINLSYLRFF